MRRECVCGCGARAVHMHHVVYEQALRREARRLRVREDVLTRDVRNLVPVGFDCHGRHHAGARRLELGRLPDSVFEFAAEVLGAGAAFEYLRRRYAGEDPRLDDLITEEVT